MVDDIDGVMLPNGDDPNDGDSVLLVVLLLSLLFSVLDPNGDEDDAIVSFFPNGDEPNEEEALWEDDVLLLPNGDDFFSSFSLIGASFLVDVFDSVPLLPN